MKYQDYAKMLQRPVNGRRRVQTRYTYVRYTPDRTDGQIELYVNWFGTDPAEDTVLATINKDNVVTLCMDNNDASSAWKHNRLRKEFRVVMFSDRRRHSNKKQPVRVVKESGGWKDAVPYFDGMQFDVSRASRAILPTILNLEKAIDKVRTLDKKAAAEVRRKLAPLIKLFQVSMKIGALDDVITSTTRTDRYYKTPTHTLDELVEHAGTPDMAQVYALYWHAIKGTNLSYWGNVQEEIRTRVPENGARILREYAYKKFELYSYKVKE